MWLIKKLVKIAIKIFICIVVLDAAFVFTMAHFRPPLLKADAIVVLGAAINTPALDNRTLTGLHLYDDGKAPLLVLSGGKIAAPDISEAQYMEKIVKKNSVTPPPYILEDQSHNTYENLRNSKEKLGKKRDIIIVSDAFHLARAFLVAKRAGFGLVEWSAPQPTYYSKSDLAFYYFREVVAILGYLPKFVLG